MTTEHHESLLDQAPIKGPSNRSFGLTVGVILAALGVVRALLTDHLGPLTTAMLGAGILLLLLATIAPATLSGANQAWMRLGALLAAIVNPIILFLIYVLVFVPIGLLLRLRGHDPLRLTPAAFGETYWIARSESDQSTMQRQF